MQLACVGGSAGGVERVGEVGADVLALRMLLEHGLIDRTRLTVLAASRKTFGQDLPGVLFLGVAGTSEQRLGGGLGGRVIAEVKEEPCGDSVGVGRVVERVGLLS